MQRRYTVDVLSLTTWQMAFGSVPLVAAALLTYNGGPEWTFGFWWGLVYTVVLANAVAWFLWLYALHALPAGAAGLGTLSIPVVGVVAAWIQLGEVPTLVEGIGMALIIGALAVLAVYGLTAGRRAAGAAGGEPDVRPVRDRRRARATVRARYALARETPVLHRHGGAVGRLRRTRVRVAGNPGRALAMDG
jgi:uncharacterized membrane protein